MVKADHQHNLKDLDEMVRLIEEVQLDARKHAHYVISLQSLRKLEQIEKLSRTVRGRMRRD